MEQADTPTILTEGLTKHYGSVVGIENLDLSVERGEVFGFLGPNGAGKTTTIRILLDLIRPTRGRAQVFGLDAQTDGLALRRRVGYLPSEYALFGGLTGRQVLEYLAALRGEAVPPAVGPLAERLGSDLSRPVRELSHGNKQKIGLIQAFMSAPDLLVLDEPTTGLDPLVQQEFYQMLAEASAADTTVFLSSHVLPEVERVCQRTAILRSGRLLAVEPVAAIKQSFVRHVEVEFEQAVPAPAFSHLSGIEDLAFEGNTLRCTVRGSIDPLVKAAAQFPVARFREHEPGLEEFFLKFYGEEQEPSDAA